jgi:hypothetical protein
MWDKKQKRHVPTPSWVGERANAFGKAQEDAVVHCFDLYTKECPEWLLELRKGTPHEDHQGIDLIVVTDRGEIMIQVKSSHWRAKKFTEKRPNIPVIVVEPNTPEHRIRWDLITILRPLYQALPVPPVS